MTLKSKAVLFGINYVATPDARLNGCVNDVQDTAKALRELYGITDTAVYTDETTPADVTAAGMIRRLNELAALSFNKALDFVWVHYSGHGSYMRDRNGDERDGRDECIIPSDFQTAGVITDDMLNQVFSRFHPRTRVFCIFDSCHSGTIVDARYSWESARKAVVENPMSTVPCPLVSFSGCLDTQTSADAWNVLGDRKFVGAMTACLLLLLRANPEGYRRDAFKLLEDLRASLKSKGFTQVPLLTSTHNLAKDRFMF